MFLCGTSFSFHGFSRPVPRGFLGTTRGFSVFFFFGFSSAVAWSQVSLTSGLLSHVGLCGCACPCVVVRPVTTSPGPWFPYLLHPGCLRDFLSPPTSCALPFTGFYGPRSVSASVGTSSTFHHLLAASRHGGASSSQDIF